MPSPFPGMDPYLEDPAIFPDLHDSFIANLRDALNATLPEPYYAGIASRTWVEFSHRPIGPDVNVLRPEVPGHVPEVEGGGGVATLTLQAEPITIHVPFVEEEFHEPFVEIYAQPGGERVVATVELLSLSNKTPGEHGRSLYKKKQREVLCSQVHLIEIDLLRGGTHSTAIPVEHALARAGRFDYQVCIHQFDRQEDYILYPIHLPQRLPVLPVPLLPGDPPVKVDLQALLDRSYDTGNYKRRVRYRERQPVPPLRPEQAAWAEQLLRAKGILEPLPGTQEVKTENK
jgi:hypothetical protein